MRKFFYPAVCLGMLFSFASCSDEDIFDSNQGDGNVTLRVNIPAEIITKSGIDDGSGISELHYAIYKKGETDPVIVSGEDGYAVGTFATGSLSTNIELKLVPSQNYTAVFWAQSSFEEGESPFTFYPRGYKKYVDPGSIDVDYRKMGYNDKRYDAFYAKYDFSSSATPDPVTLTRPFAQVNLGTDDLGTKLAEGLDIKATIETSMEIPACLNMLTGETSSSDRYYGNPVQSPLQDEEFPGGNQYKWLTSCYMLAPTEGTSLTITYKIYNGDRQIKWDQINNVPIKANYRTNLSGSLLLSDTKINVTIDPYFNPAGEAIEGETPVADASGNITVSSPAQLQGFADLVNGGETYEGKTVTLSGDIDLTGVKWTPIAKSFKGTLDGAHNTVKGVTYPIFGDLQGTVKDVNLEGTDVRMSFLASNTSGTVTVTGVTTSGSIIDMDLYGRQSYAVGTGAIIGHAAGTNVTLENCVNNASVFSIYKTGGIIGTGSATYYTLNNCKNTGDIKSLKENAGGIAGALGNSYSSFINCTNSGDVSGHYGVGGVVGIANTGSGVTMTECSNSGEITLTTNPETDNFNEYFAGGVAGCLNPQTEHGSITLSDCSNTGAVNVDWQGIMSSRDNPQIFVAGVVGSLQCEPSSNDIKFPNLSNNAPISMYGNGAIDPKKANIYLAGIMARTYVTLNYRWKSGTFVSPLIGDKTVITCTVPGMIVTPYAVTSTPGYIYAEPQDYYMKIYVQDADNNTSYELKPEQETLGN